MKKNHDIHFWISVRTF